MGDGEEAPFGLLEDLVMEEIVSLVDSGYETDDLLDS